MGQQVTHAALPEPAAVMPQVVQHQPETPSSNVLYDVLQVGITCVLAYKFITWMFEPLKTVTKREIEAQEHSQRFTEELVILWEDKQFSDVVLKANDNKEFPCHRVVLAAASTYFKAMFSSGMVESTAPTVELQNMDSDILSSLIRYMYSGTLKITTDNVQRLVESCKLLDVPQIITGCEDFMVQQLCPTNCLGFKRFAEFYELERLKHASQSTMLEQFSDVVRSTEFGELSACEIMEYISNSKLKVKTEDPVFEAVCMWVRVDPANREAQFPQIAAEVRFPNCSQNYLCSVVMLCPYMSNPECAAYLQEACTFHMQPEQRCRLWSQRMKPREDYDSFFRTTVIFGGVNNQALVLDGLYHCRETYKLKPMTKFPRRNLRCYAVVAFQNGIFVTGGQEDGIEKKDCFLYDFKVHKWRDMPQMMEGRSAHGSAVLAGNVYVLGGYLSSRAGSSVEVYKPPGRWMSVGAMPKGLIYPLAVSSGQYIFVTSGEGEAADQSVTTMVYDTVWDSWGYRKDMPKPVLGGSITALNDKIYVVGGVPPSCLSYDMAEDAWTVLTPPKHAHGYAPSFFYGGRIVVYGGKDATDKISGTLERYDPTTGTWSCDDKEYEARAGHHYLSVDILI